MKQIVIKDKNKKLVNAVIGINAGWRNEKEGQKGITHYLEHAIFLGNKQHPDPDLKTAKLGVQIEGSTGSERTLFYFSSLKEDFPIVLKLLLSLIFHPEFQPEKCEREKRESILTAVNQETNYTSWKISILLMMS
ncbi:MAG: M16 family metallopeptidase [bacterium]